MKCFWFILAALAAVASNAQTNPPVSLPAPITNGVVAAVPTNAPARPPIKIKSEHGFFDLNNHVVVYSGHVVVTDPKMMLTCDVLTIQAPTNSTHNIRPNKGVAEGNVKIVGEDDKGRPVHSTSDKAIYRYEVIDSVTNETVTLTGNVYVDSAMGKGTAEPIVWDRINNTIHAEKQDMQIQPEIKTGTNAPGTNAPAKAADKLFP